jgi:hypothetical protein
MPAPPRASRRRALGRAAGRRRRSGGAPWRGAAGRPAPAAWPLPETGTIVFSSVPACPCGHRTSLPSTDRITVARVRDIEVGAFRLVAGVERLEGARLQFVGCNERRHQGDAKTGESQTGSVQGSFPNPFASSQYWNASRPVLTRIDHGRLSPWVGALRPGRKWPKRTSRDIRRGQGHVLSGRTQAYWGVRPEMLIYRYVSALIPSLPKSARVIEAFA